MALAKSGSLFAKHLILEAVPLIDPANLMGELKAAYSAPTDYRNLYTEIKGAIPIVAISENTFKENTHHYNARDCPERR